MMRKSKASGLKYIIYSNGDAYLKGMPKVYFRRIENNRVLDFLLESVLSRTVIDKIVESDDEDVIRDLDRESLTIERKVERIEICAHKWMPYRYVQDERGFVLREVFCAECKNVGPLN